MTFGCVVHYQLRIVGGPSGRTGQSSVRTQGDGDEGAKVLIQHLYRRTSSSESADSGSAPSSIRANSSLSKSKQSTWHTVVRGLKTELSPFLLLYRFCSIKNQIPFSPRIKVLLYRSKSVGRARSKRRAHSYKKEAIRQEAAVWNGVGACIRLISTVLVQSEWHSAGHRR